MRDTGVEAELLHHITALLLAPGDAHHATALQSRDLPGNLTHAAGRRRHDRRLTGLRLALQDHARIGGESKHSENAHGVADLAAGRIELAGNHVARPGDAFPHKAVLGPAVGVEHEIPGGEAFDPAFDDLRHRAGVARRALRLLAAALVAPLIWIEGDVDCPCECLAGTGRRD